MTEETYALRARVTNLDLGILAGDILSVNKADTAEPGQLIIADTGDAWTVCRFVPGMLVRGIVLEVAGSRG